MANKKLFKVFVNYQVTGHIFVLASNAESAERSLQEALDKHGFIQCLEPEPVDGTIGVLTDVSEEIES